MSDKTDHLSEIELLQLIDDEFDEKKRAKALSHLARCAGCSSALQEVKGLSGELNSVLRPSFSLDDQKERRETLRALLRRESLERPTILRRDNSSILGYAAVGLLALGLGTYGIYQRVSSIQRGPTEILASPDHSLTPGDAKPVSYSDICPAKDGDKDPPVPASIAQSVFKEYGLSSRAHQKNFQVDYLISPQLGGTSHIRNLWPEPYETTIWNARVKDALEDRLHLMVCNGEIELSEAQHAIATDWIGAYKFYFRTESPIQTEAMAKGSSGRD